MTEGLRRPKVLCLSTSSGPGGAERVISVLSSRLKRNGLYVIVGLFRPGWLQNECERLGVDTRVIPLNGPLHLGWFLRCLRLVKDEQIDIVHAHEFSAIVCGWIIARLARIPFVGTVHGKNYFWEKGRRRFAYRIVGKTGTLVAVSKDLKQFIVDKVGVPASRIAVVYNGVEPAQSVSEKDIEGVRTELGLRTDDLVIGTVGSLYPVKGHRYLLDAMAAVLKQYPKCFLIVAGQGELEVSLKEQARRLGIEDRVRFLGMRQDVPILLAVMQLFVLPSLSEGLSMALLEAMASGKPVVATNVGGNPELVDHGRTGWLVQPEQAGVLAGGMKHLLEDQPSLSRYGRAAAERIAKLFTVDLMIESYQNLYHHLATPRLSKGVEN